MKKFFSLGLCLIAIFLIGNGENRDCLSDLDTQHYLIELPEIPSYIQTPMQRADFLVANFWNNLNVNDSLRSQDEILLEQSFVDFLSIIPLATSDSIVDIGFRNLLETSHQNPNIYKKITNFAEIYLNTSDSPMYSEDLYLQYLQALSRSNFISEIQRIRLEDLIEMMGKNRIGSKASDFSFISPEGEFLSLSKLLSPGMKIMLIFFDPECEQCEVTLEKLRADSNLQKSLTEGHLKVVAIYPGDNEPAWRRKISSLPPEWIFGINQYEIEDNDLYYLPEMPTIYLLDDNGTVLIKEMKF